MTRLEFNIEFMALLKTIGIIRDIEYIVICSPVNEDIEKEVEILGVITSLTSVI
jgi:hypothetical protein